MKVTRNYTVRWVARPTSTEHLESEEFDDFDEAKNLYNTLLKNERFGHVSFWENVRLG